MLCAGVNTNCSDLSIRAVSWVLASTHQAPYWIVDPSLAAGATVSSRLAQSRYGSAGEVLAWRPIVRDTMAFMGVFRGITPGLGQGSASVQGL